MNPKMPPVPPKMLILDFELEQKMNHHLRIKFHGESNGNLPSQHSCFAFLDESNGNCFKADKVNHEYDILIFLIGPYHLININVNLFEDDNCTTNQVY